MAVALAMLALRLTHLELATFSRDEPQFLAAAREQLRTGHWLTANPLYGNMGLRYGPTAFWFYGLVQLLLGDGPLRAIFAMGLLVTLAHLAFAMALTRVFEEGVPFFAVLLAWIASSLYEFGWSRMAWDLTSNAGAFLAVALSATPRELKVGRAIALGLVLGLAFSSHPMVAPLVAAVLATWAWELRSGRCRPAALVALAAALVAVNVPYLLFLRAVPVVGRAPRLPFTLATLGRLVLQAPRTATTWGVDGARPDFQAWLGPLAPPIRVLSALSLAACLVAAVAGLVLASRSGDPRQRRLGRTAILAWAGIVLLLAPLGLEVHPHYHFAAAWVPFFGVAALVAWLRRRRPRAGAAALVALGAVAAAQFAVVVLWMSCLRDRGGARTATYGTAVGLQIEAMRAACAVPEPHVVLRNETVMFRFPFEYLATTVPACREKTVVVCADSGAPFTRPCPPPAPGTRLVRLRYARDEGGALRVD